MGKKEEEVLAKPPTIKARLADRLQSLPPNSTLTLNDLAKELGCSMNTVRNSAREIGGGGANVIVEGDSLTVINPEAILGPDVTARFNVVLEAERFRPLNPTANPVSGGASHSGPSKSTPATSGEYQ